MKKPIEDVFFACLLIFLQLTIKRTSAIQVDESNLRRLLSESELQHLLGNAEDGDFAITHPQLSGSYENETETELILSASGFGEEFRLKLLKTPHLLSPNFTLIETYSNSSYVKPHHEEDIHCYFRSENAALSLCNNAIRGIIHKIDEFHPSYLLINPLPKRLHNETHKPHVLVIKKTQEATTIITKKHNDNNTNTKECAHDSLPFNNDLRLNNQRRIKRNVQNSLVRKLVTREKRDNFPAESPVFVETAVFVDKDLFEHMKTNFPVDTERELVRFVLAMINAVQLLYHDPSLGRPVNFLLKRLEILKEETPGLNRPPDIDRFLSSFCNWQRTKNPVGDREPQHWDHALILTGLDLYVRGKHGKISSQVVGLAPVAGMCTSTSSCTVNEGRHFESVYVVAHEIGHNLGMRHDGPLADNDCDPSSYIMSPTLGSGKITWSACSRRYLQKFLDTPQSRCLLDHGSSAGQLDHSAEGAFPGERFDANQQCILKYGRGSRHSSQQPLDDVCRDLHCERERYTWTSHPALEGTMCGHNLWCRGGRCVLKGAGLSSSSALSYSAASPNSLSSTRLERLDAGWSKWKEYSDCASGCLFGEEGRLRTGSTGIMVATRTCNTPHSQVNSAKCDGFERKYQACSARQCLNVPKLTVREFANQICTRAKDVDKELTGLGTQKISTDPEEACLVWCYKKNGLTKSRGWTFPDGTVCQNHNRNKYGRSSYCINGKCQEFICDSYDEAQFVQSPDLCPVDRDDNDITWKNAGVQRRDSGDHWISASGCHYNCISPGTGIRLVITKRTGSGKNSRSSIQLCQPDQFGCGRVKSPFQHASIVCSKYKERVRRLSGLGMQIAPAIEDPDRPCRVACQDENISHRFYLVNGEEGWFPFGTDCARGLSEKKAFCVSGKCLEFGADDTPVSQTEFTLPLLSRVKRSLEYNSSTKKVTATLHQEELEEIVDKLNQTILFGQHKIKDKEKGGRGDEEKQLFGIDLNNPIHVNMQDEEDYYNYNLT